MGGRSRRNILFASVAFFLAVAGIEVGNLVWRAFVCPGLAPSFVMPDPWYGWNHLPGATVHAFACKGSQYEYSTRLTFNSRGLNDREYPYERIAGTRRVLVLGDSVTEALQVEREDNFSERLETMLHDRERGDVEVINSGHSGFGTDNELLYFETEGVRYNPDVVVLVFNLQNDISENSTTLVRAMYAGGGGLHPKADVSVDDDGELVIDRSAYDRAVKEWTDNPWRSSRARAWLREHSWFARRVDAIFMNSRAVPQRPPDYPQELGVYRTPVAPEWMDARRTSQALLERLRLRMDQIGARLLVVMIPSRETVAPAEWSKLTIWFPALAAGSWDFEAPRAWLAGFLSDAGIDYVDVTPTFRRKQAESGRRGFFDFDPHPDRDGQAWIAEAVFPVLDDVLAALPTPSAHPGHAPR